MYIKKKLICLMFIIVFVNEALMIKQSEHFVPTDF